MFCKWCGATISESSTRCKRCGRDVPALSDCGGFYDLFPNAPKGVQETPSFKTQPPSGASTAQSQGPAKHSEGSETQKKAGNRKIHRILPTFLCGSSMMVLLFLIILLGNIQRNTSELEQLRGEIDKISTHIHEIQETLASRNNAVLPKPSEPVKTSEPILAEQNVDLSLEITNGKAGTTVTSNAHLGNCEAPVSVVAHFNRPDNALVDARFFIGEQEDCVDIAVNHITGSSNGVEVDNLAVEFDVDEALLGTQAADEIYQWRYRLAGDEEWSNLPEIFRQTNTENGTRLSYKVSDLETQAENGNFEFQLVFCRRNTSGGILIFTISGIKIPQGI